MTGNHLLGHDPAEDLLCSTWIGEEKERTVGGAVLSLFLLVTKRLYGKEWEWSIGQIKTCRKKQHVEIDDIKEMSDLICGKAAVGGNYNSTRDNFTSPKFTQIFLDAGSRISMDHRGRAYDNIFVERLWRTIKYEDVYPNAYETPREARIGINNYMNFYNHERPHSRLKYRTPEEVYWDR